MSHMWRSVLKVMAEQLERFSTAQSGNAVDRLLKIVELMTHLETVSRQIRLKNSGQTFSGTLFAPHKTCVTTVGL